MKYKLVVLDLDGTLLKDNKNISIQTVKYISLLKKRGVDVVIATGRSYYHGKKLIAPLKQDMIVLSNNGSIARHTSDDKVIFANYLEKNKALNIIKEAKSKDFAPIIHVDKFNKGYDIIIEEEYHSLNYNGYVSNKDGRYKTVRFDKDNLSKILAVCFTGDFFELETFRNEINKKYPESYNSFTCKRFIRIFRFKRM